MKLKMQFRQMPRTDSSRSCSRTEQSVTTKRVKCHHHCFRDMCDDAIYNVMLEKYNVMYKRYMRDDD